MFNDKLKGPLDFSGFFEGKVVTTADPKNQGRVGVAIKRLMPFTGSYSKEIDNEETVVKNNNKQSNNNIAGTNGSIKSTNYIWCDRASNRFEYHDEEKNQTAETGSFIVPPVGSTVFVMFLNNDIRCPYYLPFGPAVEGSSKLSRSEVEGNPKMDLMHETINGDIIGFDNENQQFFIQMSDKSGVLVDVKNKQVVINTPENEALVDMKKDAIRIVANTVNVEAKEVTVKASKAMVESDTISLKTTDSSKWAPNIVPDCPIGGFCHGGVPAGIKELRGY